MWTQMIRADKSQPNTRKTLHAHNINTKVNFVLKHNISSTSKAYSDASCTYQRQFLALLFGFLSAEELVSKMVLIPESRLWLWYMSHCGCIHFFLDLSSWNARFHPKNTPFPIMPRVTYIMRKSFVLLVGNIRTDGNNDSFLFFGLT